MTPQALSSFIWSVADLLRGDYKQSEYGRVILPFTVLRRLDCVLEATKPKVLAEKASREKKPDSALRDTEKRVHAADTKLAAKAEEAARSLDEARQSALAEIEGLAAEAAREIVGKLTGAAVDAKTARKAVAGALSRA